MKPHIEMPSTLYDIAEIAGSCHLVEWLALKEMWRGGDTLSLYCGDELLGVFGVYLTEIGSEAWFNIRPQAAPHMRFLVRQIRLTLDARQYPDLVTVCRSENGKRIAALCGFHFGEKSGDLGLWTSYSGAAARTMPACSCSRTRRRHNSAAHWPKWPANRRKLIRRHPVRSDARAAASF
jgi:hypothetical protein